MRETGAQIYTFTGQQYVPAQDAVEEFISIDNATVEPHHEDMTALTREELDAKLETIEVKMDRRVASMENKLDVFLAKTEGDKEALRMLAEQSTQASERASGLKSSMWLTSITTILSVLGIALAAYFGTQASNQSIVETTLSAYQQGRSDNASVQPVIEAKSGKGTTKPK